MTGDPADLRNSGGPLLVVLSGPSGVGKDAVLNALRTLDRPWHFVVTATTRSKRSGENNGVDYIFVEMGEFQEMMDQGELLESALVYGNWYGVPKREVRQAMEKGMDVILKVDVQGAATIRKLAPEAVFVFLAPSSMEELQGRLKVRATESGADLELRTRIAREEMKHMTSFDYEVVNRDGRLEETVASIDKIIEAEKRRIPSRRVSI